MEISTIFTSPLWVWQGKASWYFVTLPVDAGAEINFAQSADPFARRRGFGSHKVEARIGSSVWQSSIFPDKKSGSFLLPIKAAIRKAENLQEGEMISVQLRLIGA